MLLPPHIANPDPNIYLSDNYVVLDFETTNKDKGAAVNSENRIVLTVWGSKGQYKNSWEEEYGIEEVVKACEAADFVVAQNAKFELGWLKRAGADLTKIVVWDPMIGKYVEDGNRMSRRDQESLVKHYKVATHKGKLVSTMIKLGICPSQIPRSWLLSYCEDDVRGAEEVFLAQREVLKEAGLLPVMFTRCIFTPVLADIEFNGMCLDGELVEKEFIKLNYELADVERKLNDMTGGINPRSPKQLSEFIYGELKFPVPKDRRGNEIKSKAGYYSTDQDTIAGLKPRNAKQREFLALKASQGKLNAALTKNIQFFQGAVEENKGIFTAVFNQTVTKTHRLSSSGRKTKFKMFSKEKSVQFQNMPRIYKPMFRARHEGWKIGEIDQAQLEFRVGAHAGRDAQAKKDIINKVDIHSDTAKILTGAGQETGRQEAKEHTFKPLFGGQSGTEAEKQYYKAFNEKYHQIAKTQQEWVYEVLDKKVLRLETGLLCYWPDTKVTESGYITNTPKIYNLPIQNLATAEIVPVGVTYQWHYLKALEMESFLVNTIHDSSIGEVHPDEEEQYAEIGHKAFVEDVLIYLKKVYNIDFTVPLEAEVDFGQWWGMKVCKNCGEKFNPLMGHECKVEEKA